MAWYNEPDLETLNFVVVGGHMAGQGVLQESLTQHPMIICHGTLLGGSDESRKAMHESYFDDSMHVPDWYQPDLLSAEQYLSNKVFDNAIHGEQAIGVQLSYQDIVENDLWDYLQGKCRQGNFCLLHAVRNPVACFIEHLQVTSQGSHTLCPDPDRLIRFVREHRSAEAKLNRVFDDSLSIPYHELILDFQGSLRLILKYLECSFSPACVLRKTYGNRQSMQSRVNNWSQLQAELPQDVLEAVTSPTLF